MQVPPQILAKKRIEDAADLTKAVHGKLEEEAVENRKAYERFYNSLALFSSGTVALSITYLGYLKSIPNKTVLFPKVLVSSWLVLTACLLVSLYCPFLYTHYLYYARMREYLQRRTEQKEIQTQEMDNLPLANTPEELAEAKKNFSEDASILVGKVTFAKKREDAYQWLWIWGGRLARLSFPIGIALLVLFAIKNM